MDQVLSKSLGGKRGIRKIAPGIVFGAVVVFLTIILLVCRPWESRKNPGGCVVQVSFGAGLGNAVVLDVGEEEVVLCTAAHVAGQDPEEGLVAGHPVKVLESYVSRNADVAFLKVNLSLQEGRGAPEDWGGWEACSMDVDAFNELQEGDLFTIRGNAGAEQICLQGKVLSCWIYMEDFDCHMLWGQADQVEGGMSGSGVFDKEGRWIGILCGGDGAGQVAVLPIGVILAEQKNSNLF